MQSTIELSIIPLRINIAHRLFGNNRIIQITLHYRNKQTCENQNKPSCYPSKYLYTFIHIRHNNPIIHSAKAPWRDKSNDYSRNKIMRKSLLFQIFRLSLRCIWKMTSTTNRPLEGWVSGWNHQFAKLTYSNGYRGFESPSFRKCKVHSVIYTLWTFFIWIDSPIVEISETVFGILTHWL